AQLPDLVDAQPGGREIDRLDRRLAGVRRQAVIAVAVTISVTIAIAIAVAVTIAIAGLAPGGLGGAVVVAGEGGERQGGDPDQAGAARHRRSLPSDETPSDAGGRAHAARTTSRASNRARPRGPVTAASSPARPAPRLTG